jgi:hypothetical protein
MTAPPMFAVDLACRIATAGRPVALALEVPMEEQARIDAFLASRGAPADRAELLRGAFWRREFQDGRSSQARAEMLDAVRELRTRGVALRVIAIDNETLGDGRDAHMAQALLAARRAGETQVLLVGNLHMRTRPGAEWDPTKVWAGVDLREKVPDLVALDNRTTGGSVWICTGGQPKDCGLQKISGEWTTGTTQEWGIRLYGASDAHGIDGVFEIGSATPSGPAVAAP